MLPASLGRTLRGSQRGTTRWLLASLCGVWLLGIVSVATFGAGVWSVFFTQSGECADNRADEQKRYTALGKWDDAPNSTYLNWYVCERPLSGKGSCSEDWRQWELNCYKAVCDWQDYKGASEGCKRMGAQLVHIDNHNENHFVQQIIGWETAWIGLSEPPNSEEWRWENNVSVGRPGQWSGYTNWAPGEPNNYGGRDENAALMNLWNRVDLPWPSKADKCGLPRQKPQGSGTWIDIAPEMPVQAAICQIRNVQSCPDGWTRHASTCYIKVCQWSQYDGVTKICQEAVKTRAVQGRVATLATIKSAEENQIVANLCGLQSCFIGLERRAASRFGPPDQHDWHWVDGTSIGHERAWQGYTNWNVGEPNNGDSKRAVAVMNWNDVATFSVRFYRMQRLTLPVGGWIFLQLSLPLVLVQVAIAASRCKSAFCAKSLCLVSGVGSVFLAIELLIWLFISAQVGPKWPESARPLLLLLAVIAAAQVGLCCMATSRAQEFHWNIQPRWSPMGMRTAFDPGAERQTGTELTTEITRT